MAGNPLKYYYHTHFNIKHQKPNQLFKVTQLFR